MPLERVQRSIDLGAIGFNRIVKGKLSWYQPLHRCHNIAFFSMAIGVLNYPDLDWRFVSGDRHTVPVGFDTDGNPRVVMDILLFGCQSAQQPIALAQEDFPRLRPSARKPKAWKAFLGRFTVIVVPALRMRARELRRMDEPMTSLAAPSPTVNNFSPYPASLPRQIPPQISKEREVDPLLNGVGV